MQNNEEKNTNLQNPEILPYHLITLLCGAKAI